MNKALDKTNTFSLLRRYAGTILFVVLIIGNIIVTPNFASVGTIRNIISQSCPVIMTAMGMTLVISTGGIDISVGAVMALGGILSTKLLGLGVFPAVIIAIIAGCCSGLIAGFFVGKLRIAPMVITLGLMIGVRGAAQLVNDGKTMFVEGPNKEAFEAIGSKTIFGQIPVQIIPIIICIAITYILVSKTIMGRQIQMVGDNARASTLFGINSIMVRMLVYVLNALFASTAGIITVAKLGAADASTVGLLSELDAIASVAVGGTSMSGGRARVLGTLVGALTMQLITIMINMNNIPYEVSLIVKAIIIILAVYIQREKTE